VKELNTTQYHKSPTISKPIFIVGLPRTGTTFLQRLLSLDPANTSPKTWELMDPVPRLKEDLEKDAKKRIKFCQTNIDMLLSLIPHFEDVHEMGSEIAEECTVLMVSQFNARKIPVEETSFSHRHCFHVCQKGR